MRCPVNDHGQQVCPACGQTVSYGQFKCRVIDMDELYHKYMRVHTRTCLCADCIDQL